MRTLFSPRQPSPAEWLDAREAEIAALQPLLLCRVMAHDPPPGQDAPCNALTPSDVKQMLYSRTGIAGWRVQIVDTNVLEILPPVRERQ